MAGRQCDHQRAAVAIDDLTLERGSVGRQVCSGVVLKGRVSIHSWQSCGGTVMVQAPGNGQVMEGAAVPGGVRAVVEGCTNRRGVGFSGAGRGSGWTWSRQSAETLGKARGLPGTERRCRNR